MVIDKKPGDMPDVLHETFSKTIEEARAHPAGAIGPGCYALMTLGEFVPSRVVEAVVHGIDLTDALGRPGLATPDGIAITAAILDDLLARKTVADTRLERPVDHSQKWEQSTEHSGAQVLMMRPSTAALTGELARMCSTTMSRRASPGWSTSVPPAKAV